MKDRSAHRRMTRERPNPDPQKAPAIRGPLPMLICLLVLATGCTNVKPWERDNLARYGMRPNRDPLTTATREHAWFSREAANGGRSVGGGGCGCN